MRRWGWVGLLLVGMTGGVGAASPSMGCVARSVSSVYGPVPVECVPNLEVDGEPVYGAFFPLERRVRLRAGLPDDYARAVLEHEACHIALTDADIEPPPEVTERLCDAIAAQRVGRR